jgi:putative ABC transport system permease protein
MDKTNTNYDNIVFTQIETIWELHGEGHGDHIEEHASVVETNTEDAHDEHEHSVGLTSILLKTKSIQNQSEIVREYSNVHGVQVITPTVVLRKSLENIDMSKQIVYALTSIIFIMSIVLLFIITLLTAQDLRKDIKLMRFLGITSSKIKAIFIIQTASINTISLIIAFLISHLSLNYINNISTGYGIVINPLKIYNNEYLVLIIMFFVTLLPILIYMTRFFKKDITKI